MLGAGKSFGESPVCLQYHDGRVRNHHHHYVSAVRPFIRRSVTLVLLIILVLFRKFRAPSSPSSKVLEWIY